MIDPRQPGTICAKAVWGPNTGEPPMTETLGLDPETRLVDLVSNQTGAPTHSVQRVLDLLTELEAHGAQLGIEDGEGIQLAR
jgi:hypothetical protein